MKNNRRYKLLAIVFKQNGTIKYHSIQHKTIFVKFVEFLKSSKVKTYFFIFQPEDIFKFLSSLDFNESQLIYAYKHCAYKKQNVTTTKFENIQRSAITYNIKFSLISSLIRMFFILFIWFVKIVLKESTILNLKKKILVKLNLAFAADRDSTKFALILFFL